MPHRGLLVAACMALLVACAEAMNGANAANEKKKRAYIQRHGGRSGLAAFRRRLKKAARSSEPPAFVGPAGGSCAQLDRVVALAPVLLPALTPLPSRAILSNRSAKLAHVEYMERRPNYLQSLIGANLAPKGKRMYLNLGARAVADKSTRFFEKYPGAAAFETHHFEATPRHVDTARLWLGWDAATKQDPRIHAHNYAVWNRNTTLQFGMRRSASHVSDASARSVFGKDKKVKGEYPVPAIDLAGFLRTHAREDDFVVVKMDIEGAEFVVVPHLITTGAACLIDEIYLECHTGDVGDIGKGRMYEDCIAILVALRGMGIASHLWF